MTSSSFPSIVYSVGIIVSKRHVSKSRNLCLNSDGEEIEEVMQHD
jgi:hypothetical protein